MRVTEHPILGPLPEKKTVHIIFNGKKYPALSGEPIASALLASGVRTLRFCEQNREPRGTESVIVMNAESSWTEFQAFGLV